MKTHRLARVAEVIREVAATTILFELRDPRVKNVTVTRAEVSADLQNAKVFVSVMGTERDQVNALHGLQNAAGFIQSKLAKRLTTRFLPVITFVRDDGVKKSLEIARILAEERVRRGEADEVPVDEAPHDPDTDSDDGDPGFPAETSESRPAGGQDAPGAAPPPATGHPLASDPS